MGNIHASFFMLAPSKPSIKTNSSNSFLGLSNYHFVLYFCLLQPTRRVMRKIVLLAFVAALSIAASAQGRKASPTDIDRFFKSTTYAMLFNENKFLDLAVKEQIEKIWKVTPVKYVGYNEFEDLKTDAKNSFMGLYEVRYSNDKSDKPYFFLALSMGGNAGDFSEMPDLGFLPFSTSLDDADENIYMLPILLDFLQKHVENLKRNPKVAEESLRYYNKNVSELENKTILICKDDVTSGVSEERMNKKTKNDVRFVSREEIIKAVEEHRPNTVVSFLVYPKGENYARCYKMLFGTDDANLYFYGYHKANALQRGGFTRWDIERIVRY